MCDIYMIAIPEINVDSHEEHRRGIICSCQGQAQ
jgi:hypothetical protein